MGNWHFKNIWMAKIYSDVIAIFRYARMFNIAKLFACTSHFMLWYVIAIFQYARIFVFLTDGRYTDLRATCKHMQTSVSIPVSLDCLHTREQEVRASNLTWNNTNWVSRDFR